MKYLLLLLLSSNITIGMDLQKSPEQMYQERLSRKWPWNQHSSYYDPVDSMEIKLKEVVGFALPTINAGVFNILRYSQQYKALQKEDAHRELHILLKQKNAIAAPSLPLLTFLAWHPDIVTAEDIPLALPKIWKSQSWWTIACNILCPPDKETPRYEYNEDGTWFVVTAESQFFNDEELNYANMRYFYDKKMQLQNHPRLYKRWQEEIKLKAEALLDSYNFH